LNLQEFGIDLSKYPKLKAWYLSLQSLPGYEENLSGAKELAAIIQNVIGKGTPLF